VEAEDVDVAGDEAVNDVVRGVGVVGACGDGLDDVDLAGPGERVLQQRQRGVAVVGVTGFVVQIPHQNTSILAKHLESILHIRPQLQLSYGLIISWTLHPLRIMYAWDRLRLLARPIAGLPTIIKKDKYNLMVVLGSYRQKGKHPIQKPHRIIEVGPDMQKHPNHVEAYELAVGELALDCFGVECVGLPHLELVDGRRRDEIYAGFPVLGVEPLPGFVGGPLCSGEGYCQEEEEGDGLG
jgi:hypothetical protein